MKTLVKSIATVAIATMFTGAAMASTQIEAADDSVTSNLCVAAATGNKWKLHKELKLSAVDKQYVASEMTCNGMSVAEFVDQYGANSEAIKMYLNIESQAIANVSYSK